MRSICLLAALCSPLAMAQTLTVDPHSLMRMPNMTSVLQLDRLEVQDYGTLLIPSGLSEVKVGQLVLGHEARIAIVPGSTAFNLVVGQGQLGSGSQITARGAPGTYEKAPSPGRNLTVRIEHLQGDELFIDARGGAGSPGFVGLDGAYGEAPGCILGSAGRGANGDHGGNGHDGASGGQVQLLLAQDFPVERVKVDVRGGAGGLGGVGGKPGKGGASKGCIVYRADGGKSGREGDAGQPGAPGPAGALTLQRL